MRKVWFFLLCLFTCIINVDAFAVTRSQNVNSTSIRQTTKTKSETQNRPVSSRNAIINSGQRTANGRVASTTKVVTGRSADKKRISTRVATQPSRVSRAGTTNVKTRTFGTNYNSCRDAYFTCMDQFCAMQNDDYRRCVCSSKLKDIQNMNRTISQTSDSLQDFENLNIDMISKTANEVKAMLSATEGENAIKQDNSESSSVLNKITSVIKRTKNKSTSTNGTLDIGGNIKSIWSTTNLIGGSEIANLTGENLYNAVHSQCSEIVKESCAGSDLKMVASAYGMYIENDCSILENKLKTDKTNANASIRQTRHKMQDARLENYDAHNSVSVNDCIANVRQDILANTACGENYLHCLDFSGRYLNLTTGEPIYSPEFYQIENQISLSGDILKNSKNASFISMLNKKRVFAQKDLDLCRDNADDVWNEFLRQAIIEIYQGQQQRVKAVKEECLQVVNECYLNKSNQLNELTNNYTKANLVRTLELSEEMCTDKLDTCSNLYGGGSEGLSVLVATMTGITDITIEQSCADLLNTYATKLCAVLDNDSSHSYPYGCRKYAPGESRYARKGSCNEIFSNPFSTSEILSASQTQDISNNAYSQMCMNHDYTRKYISCNVNYYLYNEAMCTDTNADCYSANPAYECRKCPSNKICLGGTKKPSDTNTDLYAMCGEHYIGSLYQQFVIYALQNCTRQSNDSKTLSETLLMEIDNTVQQIRTSMAKSLAQECINQNGEWSDTPWIDKDSNGVHDTTNHVLLQNFYITTGANTLWGYCRQP